MPLTGMTVKVALVEDETSVDSLSSAGVEEDEVESTEVSVLEVVASDALVSSAGVEEDDMSSVEAVVLSKIVSFMSPVSA